MGERPILALPAPSKIPPKKGNGPRESVKGLAPARQGERLGPKFDRLAQTVGDPAKLAELRDDPAAIVPERALVFEVAGTLANFYDAIKKVPGLELLGLDDDEIGSDGDFAADKPEKLVPHRLYFTMPDRRALAELVRLWGLFQAGTLPYGFAPWREVFSHLNDIRPWGPKDRVTPEVLEDWHDRLQTAPAQPVRFEVEFWFREQEARRAATETSFAKALAQHDGTLIHRTELPSIRYHAALVEVPAGRIGELLKQQDAGIVVDDDIMFFQPQAIVGDPLTADVDDASEVVQGGQPPAALAGPVAALFDGFPMSQHRHLQDRLDIDDPDDFESKYGNVSERQHGTAMASLILNGDLNDPRPVKHRLYVRPVLAPQQLDLGGRREERMVPDQLVVDVIWRAFLRMREGEAGIPPTAPTVRIVNLSLGNAKRRFTGLMSPWARLVDYAAWRYGLLVLISAGNVLEPLELTDVAAWTDIENASPQAREATILRHLVRQRASRRLLSPAESINALTIGACYDDRVAPGGQGLMTVPAYVSSFLPNVSSALGLGYHGSVKPDLLFPGGREQVRTRSSHAPIHISPVRSPTPLFGVRAAAPGATHPSHLLSGTSVATALATHSAIELTEMLNALPREPEYPAVDEAFYSVVLKSLLVHAAQWDEATASMLKEIVTADGPLRYPHDREEITRFMGYGKVDVERVLDCAAKRATLLGWGTLSDAECEQFRVPLPAGLQGIAGFRAVSATVAWMSPVNVNHRAYRMSNVTCGPGGDDELSLAIGRARAQPDHHSLARGTVTHQRWEGERAATFVDDGNLVLNVTCKASAGELDEAIQYAVALTIEVGQGVAVEVYDEIRTRLRDAAAVRAPAPVRV